MDVPEDVVDLFEWVRLDATTDLVAERQRRLPVRANAVVKEAEMDVVHAATSDLNQRLVRPQRRRIESHF